MTFIYNELFAAESISDERLAVQVVGGVVGLVAGLFLSGDGGVEFAGGDLFGACVDEAEFASGEVVFFGAHGWAEGATEDGAVLVEIAGAGGWVEDGAGLVVGELFEEDGGLGVFVEDAGGEVAGEPGVEAAQGFGYAGADSCCPLGVCLGQGSHAFAEAGCILVGYGEDSDAALGAAGVADQVMPAAAVSVGYGGVYDLDERLRHDDSVERSRFARCPYFEMGASDR